MRVVCGAFGIDFMFEENRIIELLIDSPDMFRATISNLWMQYEGGDDFFIISQDDKEVRLDKVAEIITDPFQIDVNNKKMLSRVYQGIVQEVLDTRQEQLLDLQSSIEKLIIEACDNSEYLLTYNVNSDFAELLKLYNVRIDIAEMDLTSRIVSYIQLCHRVLNTSLFVFINLKSYFSRDMLESLFQTIVYEDVNVLLIERYDTGLLAKTRRIIIDSDACVIYGDGK